MINKIEQRFVNKIKQKNRAFLSLISELNQVERRTCWSELIVGQKIYCDGACDLRTRRKGTLTHAACSTISARDRKLRQLVRVCYLSLVLKEFMGSKGLACA